MNAVASATSVISGSSEPPRTLASLPVGAEAQVTEITDTTLFGERLLEMGLIPGTPVKVMRRGPFGDPVQVLVRGYRLSLRGRQAECVRIEQRSP